MVRAIRGATTVENNDREEIIEATKEMLETCLLYTSPSPRD